MKKRSKFSSLIAIYGIILLVSLILMLLFAVFLPTFCYTDNTFCLIAINFLLFFPVTVGALIQFLIVSFILSFLIWIIKRLIEKE